MWKKKIEERLNAIVSTIGRLEQDILVLRKNQEITKTRPLSQEEEKEQDPNLNYYTPPMHTDTYPLKEIIYLMLDLLGLEPKRTLEKIELIKNKSKGGGKK